MEERQRQGQGQRKRKSAKKKKLVISQKTKRIVATVFVVLFVFLITLNTFQQYENVTLSNMSASAKSYFQSLGAGDGYPYDLTDKTVNEMHIDNSNLTLLESDRTVILNGTAKEISPLSHTYSNPVAKANRSKMIVYDLDSGKFRVQNGSEVLKEYSLPNKIMSGNIGKKGNYGVGVYGDDAQSVLKIYNRQHEQTYSWNFKTERIVDISLSDNGKFVAVAVVYTKNADISSKLYVFKIGAEKYLSCFDYPNTTLVCIDYVKSTNIVAMGDGLRSYITDNTEKKDIKFGSDTLHNYCMCSDGSSVVVLSKYGSPSLSSLTFYSDENEVKYSVSFEKEIMWADTDGKKTAVLFKDEIKTFDKNGNQIGNVVFVGEPLKVTVDSQKIYLLTTSAIYKYKTKGTTNDKQVIE